MNVVNTQTRLVIFASMIVFYPEYIDAHVARLNSDESRHCIQSLRKRVGDTLLLVDGKGGLFEAVITKADKRHTLLDINKVLEKTLVPEPNIHIAIAPTKNISRFEWFLEKATELGVTEITPIICRRSERKTLRSDRLERILIAAMKQSLRTHLPLLNELISFKTFLEKTTAMNAIKLIAECSNPNRQTIRENYIIKKNVIILIGPEGDFSPEELAIALKSDFKPITLGNNRLRTETAGIVAIHSIVFLNM